MASPSLVELRDSGLFCPPGNFYIDPWRPVDRAVITHAHADHARRGSSSYLAAEAGRAVLHARLGAVHLQCLAYGERMRVGEVTLSLHPAGHVLGSAQVRLEHRGEVWVVSGDYKLEHDRSCAAFESVRCHTFVTESTFGLPVYRWRTQRESLAEINEWWQENRAAGRCSVLFAYAFGKAQRVLSGVEAGIGPILTHGAVEVLNRAYRASHVPLPPTTRASQVRDRETIRAALVLAPPSAQSTGWLRRFGDYSDAFASGWMHLRGARRRRAVDRGFALSDHADWPGLISAIEASGASRIIVTHGHVAPMVRWLSERGYRAEAFETRFGGEQDDGEADEATAAEEPGTGTA
jgi:putative mRNA 3-end processing factor